MKVRPALILLAAALTVSLSACGSTTGTTGGDVTDVTLSVWSPQQDQDGSPSWLAKQEEAFQAAHPEYKITWNNAVVPEDQAANTVKQDPGSAADVFMFANDQLGGLIQANAIGKLPQNVVDQVKAQNDDLMIESVTGPDGSLYGVPYTANTWFMYYDKSKLTADDVKSLDTMLAKGKVAFPLDTAWYFASFYVGNGGTLFGPEGNDEAAGIDFGGTKGSDVTTYLAGLVKNPNFVNDAQSAGLAGLKNGTGVAYFSGSWDAEAVKAALGANMGAAQPPTISLNGKDVQIKAFAGSKAAGFNPSSKNPTAAAQFAAFLGSKAAQQDHYTMRTIIPSDKTLASDPTISVDPVAIAQMDTVRNASILQPTVPAMGDYWTPAEDFAKALLSGDVTADNAAEKTEAWNNGYKS